jgi:hypothetical protein
LPERILTDLQERYASKGNVRLWKMRKEYYSLEVDEDEVPKQDKLQSLELNFWLGRCEAPGRGGTEDCMEDQLFLTP